MRVVRGPLIVLFLISFAGAGALAASGAPPFASAAPTRFEPFSEPQASASPLPARPAGVASPVASPWATSVVSGVASQAASSSDTVAVASQTDQKLTLVDTATGTSHAFDLGIPPRSMALAPNGRTAWVFSSKAGESDFVIVDVQKGERKDSKRLHDNPSAAAFSTDGRRAYVALGDGNDSPPAPNTIVFLDTKNNDEFGHVEVGEQSPGVQILRRLDSLAVAPGPNGDVLYAAGHESGTVWALDAGSGALLQQIEIGGDPIMAVPDAA